MARLSDLIGPTDMDSELPFRMAIYVEVDVDGVTVTIDSTDDEGKPARTVMSLPPVMIGTLMQMAKMGIPADQAFGTAFPNLDPEHLIMDIPVTSEDLTGHA